MYIALYTVQLVCKMQLLVVQSLCMVFTLICMKSLLAVHYMSLHYVCTQLQHSDENTFAHVSESPEFGQLIKSSGTRRLI